ncbi:MAG: Spy/CpxP family protein refolding chaperone, partial [Stellaceae bacterium]
MTSHRLSLPAFALLVGLGGLTAAAPAFAQAAAPASNTATPAPAAATPPMHAHHRSAEQFVAGRIAFLKAELKITPQQEAQWNKVAEAMR